MSRSKEARESKHTKLSKKHEINQNLQNPFMLGKLLKHHDYFENVDVVEILRNKCIFTISKKPNDTHWYIEDVDKVENILKKYFKKYPDIKKRIREGYQAIHVTTNSSIIEYPNTISLVGNSLDWIIKIIGLIAIGHSW